MAVQCGTNESNKTRPRDGNDVTSPETMANETLEIKFKANWWL
jgi:hypothetical protein